MPEKPSTVNSVCPIDSEPVDSSVVRVWQGQRIGFCCDECRMEWDDMPDQDKQERAESVIEQPL